MLRNRGLGFGTQLIKRALIHHFGLDSSSVDYQGLFHHRPQFDAFIDFLQNPTSSYPVVPGQFCSCALCSPLSSLEEASSILSSFPCAIEWKYQPAVERIMQQYAQSVSLPQEFILDGELVVVNRTTQKVKAFHDVSVLLGKNEKKLQEP